MTAAGYYGPYRPPCPAWATRTDIEAALAIGFPIDVSYVQRALDLSRDELDGPNSKIAQLRCKLEEARDEARAAQETADEAEQARDEVDRELKRVRKSAARLIPLLPPSHRWEAMGMFCDQIDFGDVPVVQIATLEGKELKHAHQVRVIGVRYRLGTALQGHTEARLVGFDRALGITRMLLAPTTPKFFGLDCDPIAWLMTEHEWRTRHALELVAVPESCLVRK